MSDDIQDVKTEPCDMSHDTQDVKTEPCDMSHDIQDVKTQVIHWKLYKNNFNVKKGGGIVQLVSHPPLKLGTRVRILMRA